MIKIINLSKSFGAQKLIDNATFNINSRERIGLVGRNGHGKTTLLKIFLGDEHADEGEIVIPKNYTTGYLSQHINFSKNSVIEEGCLGLREHESDETWRVEKILFGLGFTKEDTLRNPSEFSGGYQVRINLAKVLSGNPDLLLLDEPTNYLDVVSIRWLSNFLRSWKGEIVLITHDRSFMDSVATHTVGIHRKRVRKIEGGTDKYYEQIAKEEEVYEKTRINDEKKRKEVEVFISRFRAKARLAGLVQSRIKALQKQDRMDRLDFIKNLEFSFNYSGFPAKVLLSASDIGFSYNSSSQLLFDKVNITVGKSDRICVIGKNGKGKSTLLKVLAGEVKPMHGAMISHPNLRIGYFAQTNVIGLNENLTVEEEIAASGCDRQKARDIAGAMMFEGDMALKKIRVLSGGEKSRVLFGKIIATPCNLLLLDEPTNHLDMGSCDTLMGAIDEFEGAVIMVTHNEMFLHNLANKFIIFQNDTVTLFEGSYHDFLEKIGWDDEEDEKKIKISNSSNEALNRKDLRKVRADIQTRRTRAIKPLEQDITAVENQIEAEERTLNALNNDIVNASSQGNSSRIQELSKNIHAVQNTIEALYDKLDQLTREHDALSKKFEEELSAI